MTWQNHCRYGYHIDHIRPLEKIYLFDPKQQPVVFNYKNSKFVYFEVV